MGQLNPHGLKGPLDTLKTRDSEIWYTKLSFASSLANHLQESEHI